MRRYAPGWLRSVGVVGVAVFMMGCAAVRPQAHHVPPAQLPSATDLGAKLTQRRAELRSLRAIARLRYSDEQETTSSRQALIVERPDHVRVEVLSLLGTAFVLTANGKALFAYAADQRTLFHGAPSAENLWRYTRLWMPVNELVDIVLATPAAPSGEGKVTFEPESGDIRLQYDVDEGATAIWFSEDSLPTGAERRGRDGNVLWQTRYAEYEDMAGVAVAKRIALSVPRFSRQMQVSLDQVELNPRLDSRLFALQTPPGSRVVEIDQMAD